jgi:hypothetical protein
VERSVACVPTGPAGGGDAPSAASSSLEAGRPPSLQRQRPHAHTRSFKNIQSTIERDIHRTFPRHSLFYEEEETDSIDGDDGGADDFQDPFCGSEEITSMIRELELNLHDSNGKGDGASANGGDGGGGGHHPPSYRDDAVRADRVLNARGGQASLRRVLKAYSVHDREVGYCQGMNFIAAMFLTLVSEEEAFWMLVAVMRDEPCRMRGLFGEGMRETHMVLYVAEKLIHQFLPRLSRHFDREMIHVTMYATQWLLTQYTSSFRFDLVTRVWDCFLFEGWKITYRVMLSLLQHYQSDLLKMGFEEILAFFRELPDRAEGGPIVDAAFRIPLRRKHIEHYEKEWRERQEKEDQQQGSS